MSLDESRQPADPDNDPEPATSWPPDGSNRFLSTRLHNLEIELQESRADCERLQNKIESLVDENISLAERLRRREARTLAERELPDLHDALTEAQEAAAAARYEAGAARKRQLEDAEKNRKEVERLLLSREQLQERQAQMARLVLELVRANRAASLEAAAARAGAAGAGAPAASAAAVPGGQDAATEFFHFLVRAIQLGLVAAGDEDIVEVDVSALYSAAVCEGVPLFHWHAWIQRVLEKEMLRVATSRARLSLGLSAFEEGAESEPDAAFSAAPLPAAPSEEKALVRLLARWCAAREEAHERLLLARRGGERRRREGGIRLALSPSSKAERPPPGPAPALSPPRAPREGPAGRRAGRGGGGGAEAARREAEGEGEREAALREGPQEGDPPPASSPPPRPAANAEPGSPRGAGAPSAAEKEKEQERVMVWVWEQEVEVPPEIDDDKRRGVVLRKVSVAIPLGKKRRIPGAVFAWLPVKINSGLPFAVNADFVLPASRESIVFDRPWNAWLRDCIAPVFVRAFLKLLARFGKERAHLAYPFLPLPVHHAFFEPVQRAICAALRGERCVLTAVGAYEVPGRVRLGSAELYELLDADGGIPDRSLPAPLTDPPLAARALLEVRAQLVAIGVQAVTTLEVYEALQDAAWMEGRPLAWFPRLYRFLQAQPWLTPEAARALNAVPDHEGRLLPRDGPSSVLYFPPLEAPGAGPAADPAGALQAPPEAAAVAPVRFVHPELRAALQAPGAEATLLFVRDRLRVQDLTLPMYCRELAAGMAAARLTAEAVVALTGYIKGRAAALDGETRAGWRSCCR
eukprot:tig00001629_g9517.t1